MEPLDFTLYVLAAVGLSHILTEGTLLSPLKLWLSELTLSQPFAWLRDKFVYMLNCYQCGGFWSGVTVALVAIFAKQYPVLNLLLWGWMISLLSPPIAYIKFYLNLLTMDDE